MATAQDVKMSCLIATDYQAKPFLNTIYSTPIQRAVFQITREIYVTFEHPTNRRRAYCYPYLTQGCGKQLGRVPNMFRVVANSPAALTGYLQLSAASAQGGLGTATLERIALAVAEINGCDYCLAAHSFLGRKVAKLDDAELTANRSGASNDPKADAAVRFAAAVVPPARASQQ
ncbi:carboxymuconolactone decarboxylase family protein [Acinetobacter baumannii]